MKIIIKKKWWLRQKYHFCIVASNGRTVAQSETYYNLKDCEDTITSIKAKVGKAEVVYE